MIYDKDGLINRVREYAERMPKVKVISLFPEQIRWLEAMRNNNLSSYKKKIQELYGFLDSRGTVLKEYTKER